MVIRLRLRVEPTGEPDVFVIRGGRETGEWARFLRTPDGTLAGLNVAGYPLTRLSR